MIFIQQIAFKILSKINRTRKKVTNLHIFYEVNLCVILIDYPKYDIHPSNSLTDIRRNRWTTNEGWSKNLFLFLIQTKVCILSEFCDVHIEIKYISSNWMLFERQLWRHSLWHVMSRDIPSSWIVFHVSLQQTLRYSCRINCWNIYIFSTFFNF